MSEPVFIDTMVCPLGHSFGRDRKKRLVLRIAYGTDTVPDVLELRPSKSKADWERIAVVDVYRYAIRSRINLANIQKARERKAKKAERLARERQARAERKLYADKL